MKLSEFPFYNLLNLKGTDFEGIREAAKHLKRLVARQEFYSDPDKCFSYTLDFILSCCNFLSKKPNLPLLQQLLTLLETICNGVKNIRLDFGHCATLDTDRVINMLGQIISSKCQDNSIKIRAGRIVTVLIYFTNMNPALIDLICKSCTIFISEGHIRELLQIFNACFYRRTSLDTNFIGMMVEWIKIKGPLYLRSVKDRAMSFELLKCLNTCYEMTEKSFEKARNHLLNELKVSLWHLCHLMNDLALREECARLLSSVLYDLHYKEPAFALQSDKNTILLELQSLPVYYHQWLPIVNVGVPFVIAYLQLIHTNEYIWEKEMVWDAINNYCSHHMLPERPVLKSLLFLYPMVTKDDPVHEQCGAGSNLVNIASTCRYLQDMLTYHPTQMTWLLKKVNMELKMRLVMHWLQFEEDDVPIQTAMKWNRIGSILVLFLVKHPDIPVTHRVANLITKMGYDPDLSRAVGSVLPLLCKQPMVFSALVQIQPTIPTDPNEILSLLKIVSVSFTFFTDHKAIQAACYYSMNLLMAVQDQRSALLSFCQSVNSIKFLVAVSVCENDDAALAAINLLWHLLKIQISKKVECACQIDMPFTKALKGNSERVLMGLRILRLVLIIPNNRLLITYTGNKLPEYYNFMFSLTRTGTTAAEALRTLRILLLQQPCLAYSLSAPIYLQIVSSSNFDDDQKVICRFLRFVSLWLEQVTKQWYCDVPVDHLRQSLMRLWCYQRVCPKIEMMLDLLQLYRSDTLYY